MKPIYYSLAVVFAFAAIALPLAHASESIEIIIPDWIRNVAGFWCNDEIDDTSFVGGIQYLIENKIILVPVTESETNSTQPIPSWIKNNACWWSDGQISDKDFASGLEFLIKNGIILV